MSNLAEIKSIESEMEVLRKRIEALKASALTIEIPAATIQLAEGERYAGLTLDSEGRPLYHVILLPGEVTLDFDDALEWAVKAGGILPTRQEQSLLYANLKGEFQKEWYWSSEQHEDYPDYAWMQLFGNGFQSYDRKSFQLRARAVRRLVI